MVERWGSDARESETRKRERERERKREREKEREKREAESARVRKGARPIRMMAALELSPSCIPSEKPAPSATTFFNAPHT